MNARLGILPWAAAAALVAFGAVAVWWWATGGLGRATDEPPAPPVPDLAGWSPTLRERVEAATRSSHDAASRAAALGDLARLYHANGFTAEAAQVLASLQRLEPNVARWRYYAADVAEIEGRPDVFRRGLEETLRLEPDYAPAHERLAEYHFKRGELDRAAEHYARCDALQPGQPHAQLGLARIALQRGDVAAARERLERLVREAPDFSSALNVLAGLEEQAGNARRAADLRRKAERSGRPRDMEDPWLDELAAWCYDPARLQILGSIREQTKRPAEAAAFFRRAIELDPAAGPAYAELGAVYLQLGKLTDARKTLEAGIAAAPETADLYYTLAKVLRRLGLPQEAVTTLERAIARLPQEAGLHNHLGIALELADRRLEAIEAYEEALRLDPDHVEAHLNLGKALIALGRVEEGERLVRRAVELRPKDFDALVYLTGRELDAEQLAAAAEHLDVLEELEPDRMEVRQLRAFWHLRRGSQAARAGDPERAASEYQAGIAVDPTVADLHGNLGVVYMQLGRVSEAVEAFTRFVATAPQNPVAHLYLGQGLLRMHRVDRARPVLEQGLAIARERGDGERVRQFEDLLARLR